jgi:hypothetical protein
VKRHLAAKQSRDLTTDRKAKAGPAVLSACRTVCLLKRLKYQLLFIFRNSYARIDNAKGYHRTSFVKCFIIGTPTTGRSTDLNIHLAEFREFERIGQKVFEYLSETFDIRLDTLRKVLLKLDHKVKAFVFRYLAEHPSNISPQIDESDISHLDGHSTGLDLRQIEDLVDQSKKVCTRGMDRVCKFDLLV